MTGWSGALRRVVPPVVPVLVLLAIWEAAVRLTAVDPIVLPPPSRVITSLWDA